MLWKDEGMPKGWLHPQEQNAGRRVNGGTRKRVQKEDLLPYVFSQK
jgi:hypothetical protein